MDLLPHRSPRALTALLLGCAFLAGAPAPAAQSLLGSRASLVKQNDEAQAHGFSYLQTTADVRDYVQRGLLVRVTGSEDFEVADISFPYARPEVKTFLERLSHEYRQACGERLVVTSLTRPTTRQPWNASPLSVHPTGMAIDLRRSTRSACRAWLEKNLLALEGSDVVEATKERHPPHYHVAVFPKPYLQYLASRGESPLPETAPAGAAAANLQVAKAEIAEEPEIRVQPRVVRAVHRGGRHHTIVAASHRRHGSSSKKRVRVGAGDTLWSIAQRNGVSVAAVKRANHIRSSQLKAGQVLAIPSR